MYQIQWEPDVLKRFTEAFDQLNKTDQRRVMDSLDDTDRLLATKPMEMGESRNTPTNRTLIHLPVLLTISVDLRLQTVRIVDAKVL